jgi:uncharacterized protein (TIGR00369 family)
MEQSTDTQKAASKKTRVFDLATIKRVPVADLIGFRVTEAKAGRAVATFEATEKHANPMGTLHGGILCDVADAAMGMAFASTLGEDETFTTVELKINFFPARMERQTHSRSAGHPERKDPWLCGM